MSMSGSEAVLARIKDVISQQFIDRWGQEGGVNQNDSPSLIPNPHSFTTLGMWNKKRRKYTEKTWREKVEPWVNNVRDEIGVMEEEGCPFHTNTRYLFQLYFPFSLSCNLKYTLYFPTLYSPPKNAFTNSPSTSTHSLGFKPNTTSNYPHPHLKHTHRQDWVFPEETEHQSQK